MLCRLGNFCSLGSHCWLFLGGHAAGRPFVAAILPIFGFQLLRGHYTRWSGRNFLCADHKSFLFFTAWAFALHLGLCAAWGIKMFDLVAGAFPGWESCFWIVALSFSGWGSCFWIAAIAGSGAIRESDGMCVFLFSLLSGWGWGSLAMGAKPMAFITWRTAGLVFSPFFIFLAFLVSHLLYCTKCWTISPLSKFDILGQAIWKESLASGLVGFSANQTDKKVACFEIAMSGSRGKSAKLQSGTKPEMRPTNFCHSSIAFGLLHWQKTSHFQKDLCSWAWARLMTWLVNIYLYIYIYSF